MPVPKLNLMTQLAQHVAAVRKQGGASLAKGNAYYGGHLAGLSTERMTEMQAYCGKHGCQVLQGRDALGGPALRIVGIGEGDG